MSIAWAAAPWPGKWFKRTVLLAHLVATAYLTAQILSPYLANQAFSAIDFMSALFFLGFFLGPGALISAIRLFRDF
ncbi:hypothetical protein ACQPYK_48640 (plasmid) [Streptosporangium sp. CA-135522]|uniref:hypothetical protein n=1 Tax=Streptosporangium sp. CA-135522 TaxID=3240072 RepID=UPI003D8EDEC9